MQNNIAAIVLGAGKGTRMKSDLPKVMMPVDGKPMIRHILNMLQEAGVEKVVTVIAPDGDLVKKEVARLRHVFKKNNWEQGMPFCRPVRS